MNISYKFDGELFIVTGSTSGLGKQLTCDICESNGKVIAIGRNADTLKEFQEKFGERIIPLKCDIRDESLVTKLSEIIKLNGKIDGVVHAAGVSYDTPLRIFNEEKAHEIMDVSFWSAVKIIQLVNKKCNHNPGCSYVLVSSVSAYSGGKALFAYSAAKSAVQSLARSFCKEIASDNSRINTISPGVVQSKMTKEIQEKFGFSQKIIEAHLLGLGEPEDISEMMKFLLSDSSRWITGQDFVVDGGYLFGGFE